jgi:hypothetical protein
MFNVNVYNWKFCKFLKFSGIRAFPDSLEEFAHLLENDELYAIPDCAPLSDNITDDILLSLSIFYLWVFVCVCSARVLNIILSICVCKEL